MPSFDFNVADYKPTDYELIEAGEYDAMIIETSDKPSKSGGRYLELKLQLIGGKFANRTVYDLLNLWNRSEKATAIARSELASIGNAVGVANPSSSEQLHNKLMRVVIGVEKREDNGALKNVIKAYKPAATQQQQPVVATTGDRKPW